MRVLGRPCGMRQLPFLKMGSLWVRYVESITIAHLWNCLACVAQGRRNNGIYIRTVLVSVKLAAVATPAAFAVTM